MWAIRSVPERTKSPDRWWRGRDSPARSHGKKAAMILTYEAINADGLKTGDSIDASNTQEAVDQLRRRGLYVTRIHESARRPLAPAHAAPQSMRLPLKVLVQMTRQMAMLLRAGSGLVPAFTAIQRQIRRPGQAALLGRIVTDLEDGSPLTDALRNHPRAFDAVYCAIVAAGEASGTLTEMFERLSHIVSKTRALRKKIIGALAYPSLLIVMCFHIILVLLFFVIPRFSNMFVQLGVEAPATTKLLLSAAGAVRTYWPALAAAALAATGFVAWAATQEAGKVWAANVQLRIPVIGRLRSRLIQAQVFRTLGMLLESRVNVLEAVDLVRHSTRNRRFQRLFDDLVDTLNSGGRLSTAFENSGLVEPYICQGIHTGEESGNLGGAMTFCADMLDESNEELIAVVMKMIEPIVLIGMGVVVGGVAISLFVPLFDLTSAIR